MIDFLFHQYVALQIRYIHKNVCIFESHFWQIFFYLIKKTKHTNMFTKYNAKVSVVESVSNFVQSTTVSKGVNDWK